MLLILSYALYINDVVTVWLAAITLEVTERDSCVFCYCLIFLFLASAEPLVLDCV